ncbi:MAG: hypothetical protein RLZ32_431 [Gemmatimonadota bacterium]|jgi:hypothetical protein
MTPLRPQTRATLAAAAAALILLAAACGEGASTPLAPVDAEALAARNDSAMTAAAQYADRATGGPAVTAAVLGFRFPAHLALSAAQEAQIRALQAAHAEATRADAAALAAVMADARTAMAAGKPRSEVEAILSRGRALAERLAAAGARQQQSIDAVLTPAQRQWIATCLRPSVPSAEQRQQLAALQARFVAANQADLATIERAMAQVRTLRAGSQGRPDAATEQKIAAILAEIRPAMSRVTAAREALDREIRALLGTTGCR